MGDPPPDACEVCGASPVERVFHPVPIFFKGSGFYSTDYGRKKRKVEAASDGGGGEKSSGDGSKSADKPAETSPKKTADT
jgi:predicted nucleic acid-binding Zn ribbon protein